MATTYSILGQAAPTGSNSDLYTGVSGTQVIISTIAVCNTTASAATATIYVRKATAGTPASASTANALVYQASIPANSTQTYTLGISLAAFDTVTVASGTSGALTFHAFGVQFTA